MPLPSFSVTWTGNDVPGTNDGTELVDLPVSQVTTLVCTHNVRQGYPVRWAGETYFLPDRVIISVNPDGTISGPGEPVMLLANDSGLNVSDIWWTVTVRRPGHPEVSWEFPAPGDGGLVDLSAVMTVPVTPVSGGIDGGTPVSSGSGSISGGGV